MLVPLPVRLPPRPGRGRAAGAVGAVLTVVLLVPACAADPAPPAAGPTGASSSPAAPGATPGTPPASGPASAAPSATPTATATFPASVIGRRMRWFVGQMSTDPVAGDLATYFDSTFTQQVPPTQLLVMLGQLRTQGPWTVENVTSDGDSGVATLVSARGGRFTLSMTVTKAGLIDGALLRTVAAGSAATSWSGVDARLKQAAPDASVLAVTLDAAGRPTVVHRSGSQEAQPVASIFKLYVLAAVAEQVAAGSLAWDRQLTLTAADVSLPSGDLRNSPPGTKITVRDAAQKMIAASDNTAADLLLRTVGEPAVLAAATRAGNDHPEGITPFLSTRQMFWLAWDGSDAAKAARAGWKDADAAQRRRLLSAVSITGPGPASQDDAAHWSEGIEWFATPDDVVEAHVRLQRLAAAPAGAPLREILSKNGGVEVPGWSYQAFKGGSDTGVLGMSFYGEVGRGANARRQALVVLGRGTSALDEATFVAATTDAAKLLSAAE
ncbi:serine hydrolase [Agilicoccus flavus]|uniref:serine hydrolase n=1 Tax=Agilicoccus flavus TaxID=2775968 RepID=UPI001CF61FB1|nr:serine hydrolase [Agilicoccus flavus]